MLVKGHHRTDCLTITEAVCNARAKRNVYFGFRVIYFNQVILMSFFYEVHKVTAEP